MGYFLEELLKAPDQDELEITVFGPGYGEAIVLHIPSIGWGVIDCCKFKSGATLVNLPLEYLNGILSPKFPAIAFLILTHPHEDHYIGIDEIIMKYSGGVNRICWYAGNGIRELKRYIANNQYAGNYVLPGFANVLNAMENAVSQGSQTRKLSELTTVVETDRACLIALSPSVANEKKYVEKLFKALPEVGKPMLPMNDNDHNLISVVLFLRFGKIQAVFGSDLEESEDQHGGWNAIVTNTDCPHMKANVVKVSHHGSMNGYNDAAWKEHCSADKPIAVITPFNRGSKHLPESELLNKITPDVDTIFLTSESEKKAELHDYYRKDVVNSIKYRARSFRIIEPADMVGIVRLRYNSNGQLIEKTCIPPAKAITN